MPVVDASDYKALYRRTKEMPPEIRRAFRKHLREAGNIGRDAARDKILAMPTHGPSHMRHQRITKKATTARGLRATLAANIRVSVTGNNVRVRQFTAGLTGRNAASLPRLLDQAGQFHHPVFEHGRVNQFLQEHPKAGHRHGTLGAAARGVRHLRTPQADQQGWPYFREELKEVKRPEMERAVAKVLDDISDHLAGDAWARL